MSFTNTAHHCASAPFFKTRAQRRQYGLLEFAMRALMGRTVIVAVGTIAHWATYSSPLLPQITKSCGGMLRMFTGGIAIVARAAAVQLSHSFAITPLRNFILTLLNPWERDEPPE